MIRLKSPADIQGIRDSGKLLADTFQYVASILKEGMTGLDLDALVAERIKKNRAKAAFLGYNGFPNSVCVSVNNAVIHGIPNAKPFAAGDLVGVDCGIDLRGYISDMAYTYAVGPVSDSIKKLLKTAEESLYLGIEQAVSGKRIHDISRAIFQHNKAQGYGIVRPFCGHGVGFEVHEEPQVPNYVHGPNPRLKPGMVIAIEPMVNLGGDEVYTLADDWTVVTRDASVSVHFEHTVAILEDSNEILTRI